MTWDLTTLDDMEELDMTELTETLDSVKPVVDLYEKHVETSTSHQIEKAANFLVDYQTGSPHISLGR